MVDKVNKVEVKQINGKATQAAETLLIDYAAGALDEALSLIVATHLVYSQTSREFVKECEEIGGHLLNLECGSEKISEHCLDSVLQKIELKKILPPVKEVENNDFVLDGLPLPKPLAAKLQNSKPIWHNFMSGMEFMDVLKSGHSSAKLLRVAPAVKTPDHSHKGLEVTLILNGAFHDETGTYSVGDLIVEDETTTHAPIACPQQGCVCLTVTTAPIKLTGWLGTFINPFLR